MQGFFGKIPSHGDFVRRELPHRFVDPWDDWLQRAVAASKAEMGDNWLDTYLTSPIWRFALVPGICGDDGWAGILMPSVDRVGRYFPLTVASSIGSDISPFSLARDAGGWFAAAEEVALQVLEQDHVDADSLATSIASLDDSLLRNDVERAPQLAGGAWGLRVASAGGTDLAAAVSHELVTFQVGDYSMWWTDGSEELEPMALVAPSLPAPECFAQLLRGSWGELAEPDAPPPDTESIEEQVASDE